MTQRDSLQQDSLAGPSSSRSDTIRRAAGDSPQRRRSRGRSSDFSQDTRRRALKTGDGWRAPSELPGSVYRWVGGGRQGGVPDRGSWARSKDLTALGREWWSSNGWTPNSGPASSPGPHGSAADHSSYSSSSTSSSASTTSISDPWIYDMSQAAFICRSLSECEPCPAAARNHPFCRPYGNRRLLSCETLKDSSMVAVVSSGSSGSSSGNGKPRPPADAEFVGWEACGKVVNNETRDYLEFVMILVLLSLFGLAMLIRRNREVATRMRIDPDFIPLETSLGDSEDGEGGHGRRRTRAGRSARRNGARGAR